MPRFGGGFHGGGGRRQGVSGGDPFAKRPPEPMHRSSRRRFDAFKSYLANTQGKTAKDAPADEIPRASKQDRKEYLRRFRQWMWPYRWGLAFLFLLAIIGSILSLMEPLFTRHLLDNIVLADDLADDVRRSRLYTLVSILFLLLFLQIGIHIFRRFRQLLLNSRIMVEIRRRLFYKMVRLSLNRLEDMKVGGVISRLSSDVNAMAGLFEMLIMTPGIALLQLVGTLAIVMFINWRLALAALIVLPPMAIISSWWVKKGRPVFRAVHEDRAQISGRLTETFSGIRVVRTFQREHKEEFDYTLGQHTVIRKDLFAHIRLIFIDSGWMFIMAASGLIIIAVGGVLIINGSASVGDVFAFQMYTAKVFRPVYMIIQTLSSLQNSLASMERVMDVLDQDEDKPDRPDAIPAPSEIDEIRFDSVTFGYDPEKPVVYDLDVAIPGRTTVAIVGRSGAGKSTITDLIARFYDPTQGAILLNGVDLRDYQRDSYRRLLGIVQQEVFLFDGTVRENIAYGKPDATDDEIREAARSANADDFIMQFSENYDSVIGERGVKLSGGQRQRLSIARAFLANPRILILDEATSNLDTESEQLIQQSLHQLMRERTTFVIAHRLSTITYSDMIIVLDEGRIVEVGPHRELMAQKGVYFAMIERQRELTV